MRNFDFELKVIREEGFTLDFLVQNPDGTPYVVSNQLLDPHVLISVASSTYDQHNRYLRNYWLPLTDLPKFYYTAPVNMAKFKNQQGTQLYTSFDTMTGLPSGYYDGKLISITEADDAVYYFKNGNTIDCRYWNGSAYVPYEFRIVKSFLPNDTKDWVSETYRYDITLVDGQTTKELILSYCDQYDVPYTTEDTLKTLIDRLKWHNVDLDIDINNYMSSISTSIPILAPTKISVISNVRR